MRPAAFRRGSTLLIVIVVVGGILLALGVAAYFMFRGDDGSAGRILTEKVFRGDFIHDVVEAGEVESSENVEIRCEVKSRNGAWPQILSVKDEGSFVRGPRPDEIGNMVPGDLLVEIDSSGLVLDLQQEEILLNNKKAARDQAANLLKAARSALREYLGDTEYAKHFPADGAPAPSPSDGAVQTTSASLAQDVVLLPEISEELGAIPAVSGGDGERGMFHVEEQALLAEKFVAEENLRRAEQYWQYSVNLAAKGYVTAKQLASDRFALAKAEKDLEGAIIKLSVLREHTKHKTVSQLLSDINNAEAVFLAEESSVRLQEERVEEIKSQIEKCTIYAPQDGVVIYANVRDRRGGIDFLVEPGAHLRERQVIVRLPNSQKMQVQAKVSEAKISLLESDQPLKATVTIDAFEGMELDGIVTRVNDYPEPTSWFSSTVKEYVAHIKILDPPPALKTGLTAKVRIHAQFLPDVLQVPIQAIYRHRGRYYCFVREPSHWRAQPVALGSSNDKHVVIREGLEQGQTVAMDPAGLVDDVSLPDAPPPGA